MQENFLRRGLLDDHNLVQFLPGSFNVSLPRWNQTLGDHETPRLALLLLDADAHGSTRDALENAYPWLERGGFVIIDDFHIPECREAVHAYRRTHGIQTPILPVPADYVYTCRKGEAGTPIYDEPGVMIPPHAAYWRKGA